MIGWSRLEIAQRCNLAASRTCENENLSLEGGIWFLTVELKTECWLENDNLSQASFYCEISNICQEWKDCRWKMIVVQWFVEVSYLQLYKHGCFSQRESASNRHHTSTTACDKSLTTMLSSFSRFINWPVLAVLVAIRVIVSGCLFIWMTFADQSHSYFQWCLTNNKNFKRTW